MTDLCSQSIHKYNDRFVYISLLVTNYYIYIYIYRYNDRFVFTSLYTDTMTDLCTSVC